jgi:hypothetical protein
MKTYTITSEQLKSNPRIYPGVTAPGAYTYDEDSNTYRPVVSQPAPIISTESPLDFDGGGFGIGGLGRYEERPIIPTAAQLDRQARREAGYVKCDCGHSVPASQVMSASLGTACPDCYDRMSD